MAQESTPDKYMEELLDKAVQERVDITPVTNAFTPCNAAAYIPTLTFLSGPYSGREIPILHQQIIIGRGYDCDIIVVDRTVSRRHIQINSSKVVKKREGVIYKVLLKDLDSKNGTLINYSSKRKAVLQPGDKIIMGRIVLKFEHKDPSGQNFIDQISRHSVMNDRTSLSNQAGFSENK